MMGLLEISVASEEVRRQVIHELGFDRLLDMRVMRAVVEDLQIQRDIEAVAEGSIPALWRLQKHPKILDLAESSEILEVLDSHSFDEIVEALQRCKANTGERR